MVCISLKKFPSAGRAKLFTAEFLILIGVNHVKILQELPGKPVPTGRDFLSGEKTIIVGIKRIELPVPPIQKLV